MRKTKYEIERDGQIAFFDAFKIPHEGDNSALVDNTDGVYNGNLLEFKLSINDLNRVLFQAIKYCSQLRIKGRSVPSNILLIDLNNTTVYLYQAEDYRSAIQTVYNNSASKENSGFIAEPYVAKYDYSEMTSADSVKQLLKETNYMPIDIDEDCIVGWAERYYRENPKANKGDFIGDDTGESVRIIGEIRDPKYFKGLIRPYKGKTNERFKYLMDCLNDRLSKKDLGAFYTPEPYARKAAELVQMAVDRVPEGNDFIILDRCAGTGNLEEALIGLYDREGNTLLSHCIVSTYEYYEYKVLQERIGDMVRHIIPPTEANVEYENGKVSNADAMSEEYINNPIIKQYVNREDCTIILYENPPYTDTSSDKYINEEGKKVKTKRKDSYVAMQYKNEIKRYHSVQSSSRELSNLFIWSGFKYYLRHSTDSYVIFSPVKYFKSIWLVQKKMIHGFLFNRKYFHAKSQSAISCILWTNEDDTNTNNWMLDIIDIIGGKLYCIGKTKIKKVFSPLNKLTDSRVFNSDIETSVFLSSSGEEIIGYKYHKGRKPIFNKNNIGYLTAIGFAINAINYRLTRCNTKSELEQCFGFHLRNDNYQEMLPLWCAKLFPQDEWFETDIYFTTADGGDVYTHDSNFLKSCLIYTCLSNQNKCLTFNGSDGRHYQNELCFDEGTVASADLDKYKLDKEEQGLIDLWNTILTEARSIANKNGKYKGDTLGVYQITKELNTFHEERNGKYKHRVYDYPELNGNLETLKSRLKEYYNSHIREKMFEYELVK